MKYNYSEANEIIGIFTNIAVLIGLFYTDAYSFQFPIFFYEAFDLRLFISISNKKAFDLRSFIWISNKNGSRYIKF